jgi:murein DD-endopeptidase MepM/ murein hydrolase activator NlpD
VVFFDYNGNGVHDDHEPPVPDATVQVGDLTATSAPDGSYTMEAVPKGEQAVKVSAEDFRYISLSLEAFQSSDRSIPLTIDSDTRRDWGLMQGFLTLPFRCETIINFIIHVDVDRGPAFRDWQGSDGSDYVRERSVLNGHLGTDFAVSGNPPVVTAAPGVVTEAEDGWPNNPKAQDPNTGLHDDGNRVVIDHGRGLLTIYCHLDSVSVVAGQEVTRGQTIGLSGRTGCFAPGQPAHLHFQFGGFGQSRIDPYRDLLDADSHSWWTKDNDPQCLPQ